MQISVGIKTLHSLTVQQNHYSIYYSVVVDIGQLREWVVSISLLQTPAQTHMYFLTPVKPTCGLYRIYAEQAVLILTLSVVEQSQAVETRSHLQLEASCQRSHHQLPKSSSIQFHVQCLGNQCYGFQTLTNGTACRSRLSRRISLKKKQYEQIEHGKIGIRALMVGTLTF